MKNLVLLFSRVLLLLLVLSQTANAQWSLFADLLKQMDNNTFNQYFGNLNDLDNTWDVDQEFGNVLLNDLYSGLENPFPGGVLDSSFLDVWDPAYDLLNDKLPGLGLSNDDQDTILGQFTFVQDIFGNNFDSLGGAFGQYQDELVFDSSNWNVVIIGFDDMTEANLDILQDSLDMFADPTLVNGPGDVSGIIGKLFDAVAFPDLELAFGIQQAKLKYWELPYAADAKVIRIGSVPRFNRNVQNCPGKPWRLPIEARWHVQASWTDTRPPAVGDAHASNNDANKFNPLLLSGDFAMMAIPIVGRWGNTSFRLITSLGMEAGTYAPAHADYRPPFTLPNKGFATGFGPQLGGGFAMTTGLLTIYSIGTVTKGETFRSRLPYKYNAARYEVGMRYGNIINVRYSVGDISWQSFENRTAKINNQLTIGLILSELHL